VFQRQPIIIQPFRQAITLVVANLEHGSKAVGVGDGFSLKIISRRRLNTSLKRGANETDRMHLSLVIPA
jgi:hypothetical protein